MKKLQLNVDDLHVDPFDVMPREVAVNGTVAGRDAGLITEPFRCSYNSQCYVNTCGSGSCDTGNPCVACRVAQ